MALKNLSTLDVKVSLKKATSDRVSSEAQASAQQIADFETALRKNAPGQKELFFPQDSAYKQKSQEFTEQQTARLTKNLEQVIAKEQASLGEKSQTTAIKPETTATPVQQGQEQQQKTDLKALLQQGFALAITGQQAKISEEQVASTMYASQMAMLQHLEKTGQAASVGQEKELDDLKMRKEAQETVNKIVERILVSVPNKEEQSQVRIFLNSAMGDLAEAEIVLTRGASGALALDINCKNYAQLKKFMKYASEIKEEVGRTEEHGVSLEVHKAYSETEESSSLEDYVRYQQGKYV